MVHLLMNEVFAWYTDPNEHQRQKNYWHIHTPCYIKRKRSQPIPLYRYINDILEINTIPILVLIVKGPSLFDSIIRVVPLICCKGWKARKQRLC